MPFNAPAIVFAKPGAVEVRDVLIPDPGPDEVLVRTSFSGVSQGTERWLLTGRYNDAGSDVSSNYPCLPGYQAAGVVELVGESVTSISPGDQVMLQGTRLADPAERNPGPGLASHVGLQVARADGVTRVAKEVDLAAASLYRMVGVARHGIRLADVAPGEKVVVIGLGMIGQMSAQAARRRGATVVGADLIAARVEAAGRYSVDVAVDVSQTELSQEVSRHFPGGPDVVIDTTGVSAMFGTCLELVRREGRILLQGYYPDQIRIDFHPAHEKRVAVLFPCGWDGPEVDAEIARDLESGELKVAPLISHRFPYSDARLAYELVCDAPQESLGMVFDWQGTQSI